MKLITNEQVNELVTTAEAVQAMRAAFAGAGSGAQQARVRTSAANGVMLSMMGAVLPDAGIAGAKVYTTIKGAFKFVITLFSSETGAPLATIEGDTMTGLRTAAATAVACDALARKEVGVLAVIGTGVQARSHIPALLQVRSFKEILIAGLSGQQELADEVTAAYGIPARVVSIDDAARQADVLVTVTRAATPLFDGALLKPGTFVAAVGASKATVRELDDTAISRAAALVVEWKPQAQIEAGDLVQCAPGTFDWDDVWELSQAFDGSMSYQRQPEDIVIYKAIGIGLEDIALAGLAYRKAAQWHGW
ncbi:ornithine cyclodeaminase [Herbaspirillum sp. Sphag1AN]|uniref:ornithine cyclodeaminase family protein n=1 Tax=unclassified Herbaspirillum TaxID=2624150 RepID=UPI0016176870|nr:MULTISPECIES: ornithine cyclodeaminase family protein [unclassified Herbaspirillum]MBB3214437.1 ornithine cyclodeaminase [Herbaspirillum sp. Sphag1AN]MBB3247459.1 ornithine cyclodeaminase [Herbaspirillum sp. Sphag64]